MTGLLEGKLALVAGVANRRSIAWAVAQELAAQGAKLAFTYQGARIESSVRELAASIGCDLCVECDVGDEASLDRAFAEVAEGLGGLDLLVHSIAFAQAHDLEGRFTDTKREDYLLALNVSSYSLVAMTRRAEPLMRARGGGAIVTMTYLGGERAVPHYNVMGVAKAALESSMRYLAADLGEAEHPRQRDQRRPGAHALGALDHRASRRWSRSSPSARRSSATSTPSDVGSAALYLLSPMAASVTGTILYVDGGYHAMGM